MAARVVGLVTAATMASVPVPVRTGTWDCDHQELAYLGEGGTVSYYRCRRCGKAVIEERSRRWVLRGLGDETLGR